MAGKYIIGVDGGSQSSKVVVFDFEGNVVCEGRQVLRPMSRPRNGIVEHPDDDLWDSITAASRQAMAAFPGDPGRHRRRRPVHDPLRAGLSQARRLAVVAGA